ncbi:MAG: STAS/SEC14 domain-containing protein [Thermodesulfobacteriota bacterium]
MLEHIPDLPGNVVGFSATGTVTADDYESVLIPTVETKLKDYDKIRMLYYLGPDFKGFSVGAMWDDAKVGLRHITAWEKIAVVSDVEWIRGATKFFGFAIPGQVKVFSNAQLPDAREWITA